MGGDPFLHPDTTASFSLCLSTWTNPLTPA